MRKVPTSGRDVFIRFEENASEFDRGVTQRN